MIPHPTTTDLHTAGPPPPPITDSGTLGPLPEPVPDFGTLGVPSQPVTDSGALGSPPSPVPDFGALGPPAQPVPDPGTLSPPQQTRIDAGARSTGPVTAPPLPVVHADAGRAWSVDPYSLALRTGRGPLFLRRTDGWLLPLDVERWCADADAVDLEVLRRCEGAVLDVGCGPGRLVAALSRQGRRVLGIDVSEAAVARTRRLGAPALRRSVFESLPGEGRWGTALLIDGNIGIGGDPAALLDRTGRLLAPGGLLIAETVPDLDLDERVQVHVTDARGATGTAFPWARLGTPALLRYAERAGWRAVDHWTVGGRSFATLRGG